MVAIVACCLGLFALATAVLGESPLAGSSSAFLRAHADSPVGWMPWGTESFARAKAEQKPIFLAVGEFTNELSRAMREQSFARPEIAALLNEHFVCVLVDRNERRDVADLFQTYVRLVKQMDGWPLNVWLTPELKPFDGATYLPPSDEWGKEGFPQAVARIRGVWQSDPDAQRRNADEAAGLLAADAPSLPPPVQRQELSELLAAALETWRSQFDAINGGFGEPPRYPEPELLRYLLQGDSSSRDMALQTLRKLSDSALRDPLDGGFFRYATDPEWRVPCFQKTLTDQARLALAYLDATKLSRDPRFAAAARAALNYALTLGDPSTGFAAAEDATPGELAPSFLWTYEELRDALGADAEAFSRAFGVTLEGNVTPDALLGVETAGRNILRRLVPLADDEAEKRLERCAQRLRVVRAKRPLPLRDGLDRSGAHGLLLSALTRGGAELRDDRLSADARRLYGYIRDQLCAPEGRLRAFAAQPLEASPCDYAYVADGLFTYGAATGNRAARELATALKTTATRRFWNEAAGRFFAYADHTGSHLFSRAYAPAPGPGDPPSAETAWLLTLAAYEADGDALRSILAAAIAMDVRDGSARPRGDQLLALQALLITNH